MWQATPGRFMSIFIRLQNQIIKPLTRDKFAGYVDQLAHNAGYQYNLTYDPDNFRLLADDSQKMCINLSNIYSEYYEMPFWQRKKSVARFIRSFLDVQNPIPHAFEEVRPRLLPRIRERMYMETIRHMSLIEDNDSYDVTTRIIGEHLSLELVYDRPDTIVTINNEHLNDWGITFDDAIAIANDNLSRLAPNKFTSPRDGVYISAWNDCYDASRLHLPDVIPNLKVKGRPVAMVPNRNILIVTGSDDEQGLVAMAEIAEQTLQKPRPMSGFAFRLDNGWTPFLPEPNHPAYTRLFNLAARELMDNYKHQKSYLDQYHQKNNIEVFVASVMTFVDVNNQIITVSTWSKGGVSLLPKTDQVALIVYDNDNKPKNLGAVKWDELIRVVGSLIEPVTDTYPLRYRVSTFPTDEQIAAMEFAIKGK